MLRYGRALNYLVPLLYAESFISARNSSAKLGAREGRDEVQTSFLCICDVKIAHMTELVHAFLFVRSISIDISCDAIDLC